MVLDRRQEAMATDLGERHRVVRGVAGSGKTLNLAYRARLLARALPQHRALVVCYNRTLAGVLEDRIVLPTIHSAKGLEFSHVLHVRLPRRPAAAGQRAEPAGSTSG